jgi:hypothetical protein
MVRGISVRVVTLSFVVSFCIALVPARHLRAAPVPPELVVNHGTEECAEFFGGDECMTCYPPEGWEILGYVGEVECPAGYTFVEHLESECRRSKSEFCCSEGHSGIHGDCEDMVVHRGRKLCAFVDDIHSTTRPAGWDERPQGLASDGWYCPYDYEWVDSPDEATDGKKRSRGIGLPCLGAALIAPAALAVFLVTGRHR